MSSISFGRIVDDWNRNSAYEAEWSYAIPGDRFDVTMKNPANDIKREVSAKAVIPNSLVLNKQALEVTLNVLAAQIGLYESYGIEI